PKFIKTVWGWGTPLSKKGNTRSRRRSLRIWGGYLLVLMAWVVAVMALAFLGSIICASITWQPSPLYDFLNWVRDYIVLVCIVTVLAGWVVISFYFISKPIKQLDVVANAAEQLSRPSEEPIQLPDSLEDISIQLNLAREQALRDARAAREAEQRKNDLIVYLAHDLKTPLTSVIGYLTLLRDEPQISPEIRARYTGIALEKAERLEDLINEFFDITRFNLSPGVGAAERGPDADAGAGRQRIPPHFRRIGAVMQPGSRRPSCTIPVTRISWQGSLITLLRNASVL
ncbi:MAG: sensor histidine kinase, partial [Oscillospiraceae bacterium]